MNTMKHYPVPREKLALLIEEVKQEMQRELLHKTAKITPVKRDTERNTDRYHHPITKAGLAMTIRLNKEVKVSL